MEKVFIDIQEETKKKPKNNIKYFFDDEAGKL